MHDGIGVRRQRVVDVNRFIAAHEAIDIVGIELEQQRIANGIIELVAPPALGQGNLLTRIFDDPGTGRNPLGREEAASMDRRLAQFQSIGLRHFQSIARASRRRIIALQIRGFRANQAATGATSTLTDRLSRPDPMKTPFTGDTSL